MPIARRVAVVALAVAVPLLVAVFFVAGGGKAAASGGSGTGGVETIVVTVPSSTPAPTTTQAGSGTGGLVFTGADVLWPVLAGLALLGAGTLFAMAGKRRRRAQ